MSKTDGPITLFFEDFTRIAGETIQGRVVLDVASAQEDNLELLRIKFRGTIRTHVLLYMLVSPNVITSLRQIMTSNGNTTVTHTQTILLIHEDLLLWDQGTVPPEPASESHIMSYPFHFTLPETLPPSFHCLGYHKNGTIGYSLEVVGERSRFFRFNRRIRRPISVRIVEAGLDDAPEWVPAPGPTGDKRRGTWRRGVRFEAEVAVPYAPTSSTETLDWQYELHFVVPFPGLGNDLEVALPLHLHPGSACPPPPTGVPGSSSMSMAYADVLPAGPPPPMLDLPPAYWAGEHHAWDGDEKPTC